MPEVDEENGSVRLSTGTMQLMIVPRVLVDWPEVRAENMPALVLPLWRRGRSQPAVDRQRFSRRARLVGEHRQECTAFGQDERVGYTLIGEGAICNLDPSEVDQGLNRIDVERCQEIEEHGVWLRGNPQLNLEVPWVVPSYKVWDDTGRKAALRACLLACWSAMVEARVFSKKSFE